MDKILLAFLVGLSFTAQAAVSLVSENNNDITLNVTERYVLGDNDTLTDAKKVVLEQAKKSATDYAGSYVESSLSVSGNQITQQQIRVLSAGFMEVVSSDYQRSVNKSGSIVLDATAKIKLSKKSIQDGLEKLKTDPERQAKIDKLEENNQRLRRDLLALTKKINNSESSRTDLMKAREAILSDLNNNRSAAKQVFEQGTLFQLAMLDDSAYDLAKKDIDENVFGYMRHEMKIDLGKPEFYKNKNGNYNISVPVKWNLKMSPAQKVLDKYFHTTDRLANGLVGRIIPYAVGFDKYANQGDKQKEPYTHKLVDYLYERMVAIKVSAGNKYGYLPIGMSTGGFRAESYAIQFSNDSKKNVMISSAIRNPLIIKDVTKDELNTITSLEAKVAVLDAKKMRSWKYE